jgi:hypothetical protein
MALKLIKHTGSCNYPDDPSLPFKIEIIFRASEFMGVTWSLLHGGTEDIVVRGDTLEELTSWVEANELKTHFRFIRYAITDAEGKVVDSFDRNAKPEVKIENTEGAGGVP